MFVGRVYSRIATELSNGRHGKLAQEIIENLITPDEKPTISGLHMTCAIIQMTEDETNEVGSWLDLSTMELSAEPKFKRKLRQCCERISKGLIPKSVSDVYANSLLDIFNYYHQISLNFPEFLFLQVLSLFDRDILLRALSEIEIRNFNYIGFCDNGSIDKIFVPKFRANVRNENGLVWKDAKSIFDRDMPSCISRHVKSTEICDFEEKFLLWKLANDSMIRETVVSVFLSYNFLDVSRRVEGLYNRIIPSGYLQNDLVSVDDELCMLFNNYGIGHMYCFSDMGCPVINEQCGEPAYAFMATTLGLYLRIIYRIDAKLRIPPNDYNFFSDTTNDQVNTYFFFTPIRPIEKSTITTDDDKEITEAMRVNNINRFISAYVIRRRWVDTYMFRIEGPNFDIDSVYELFAYQEEILNDEQFIETGAEFVSTVYGLTKSFDDNAKTPFVKYIKSIETCQDEFNELVAKL